MSTIGENMRARREQLKMTQTEVAKVAHVSTGHISDLENGWSKSSTHLNAIAKALHTSVDALESGKDPRGGRIVAESSAPYAGPSVPVSDEGARLGAEWDKIQGEEYRKLVRELIEGMVAAQKRASPAKSSTPHKGSRKDRPDDEPPRPRLT